MIKTRHLLVRLFLLSLFGTNSLLFAQTASEISLALRPLPTFIYGVTVDSIEELPDTIDSLKSLAVKPMTRVVFDPWQPASDYAPSVSQIYGASFVMGEILDSYSFSQYNLTQYKQRTKSYFNNMKNIVDIWEVGNEINGEWLGGTTAVVAKVSGAYDIVKAAGGRTALTLYYNPQCWEKPSHEMFRWVTTNIPARIKQGVDYVWVSYYEEDCNNYQPNWSDVMNRLSAIFPNSKIGIGECGTRQEDKKAELVKRYYSLKVNLPAFVGGYFWWYFKQDMVPKTQPLWDVLNTTLTENPVP